MSTLDDRLLFGWKRLTWMTVSFVGIWLAAAYGFVVLGNEIDDRVQDDCALMNDTRGLARSMTVTLVLEHTATTKTLAQLQEEAYALLPDIDCAQYDGQQDPPTRPR